jgi:hypothetical protein
MCKHSTLTKLASMPRVVVWQCVTCGQAISDRRLK